MVRVSHNDGARERKAVQTDQPGDGAWLIPGYRITGVLGRGGFATVYQAWQWSMERDVAVKVLTADLTTESDRRRFDRERRALSRLSMHPHVVEVFDAGITPERRPYFVMRLYPNGSLAGRLTKIGPLTVEETVDIVAALADALDTAHSAGILHRDVKPSNVLLTEQGTPVLADFGIARALPTDPEQAQRSTAFFSLGHVAPEVLAAHRFSVASDVYALASTTYQLLSGRTPFPPTDPRIGSMILDEPAPPLDVPGVSPTVAAVIHGSLAKDPQARAPRAGDFAEALATAAAGGTPAIRSSAATTSPSQFPRSTAEVVPGEPASTPSSATRGRRSHRRRLLAAGLSAAVVLTVGASAAVVTQRSDAADAVGASGNGDGVDSGNVGASPTDAQVPSTSGSPSSGTDGDNLRESASGQGHDGAPVVSSTACMPPDDLERYTEVTASARSKFGYTASAMVDGDLSSVWSEGVDGLGEGETITFTFSRPVTVSMACLINGITWSSDLYKRNARIRSMDVITDSAQHVVQLEDLGLTIAPATYQQFPMPEETTTKVTFRLRSFYGPGIVDGKVSYEDTCLTEVAFWYRPTSG
jgi:serine/threonine protein kinase